ncbi:MAG: hypothetical protein IT446_01260 [Phycisphaerales bacterium]|nr:hypothetical protein [Phycisphaerales bacterium]
MELATDSAIAALESAQSKYDAYLNAFNSVQQAADQYMRDQWYTSQADWDVLSAIQKLPRDIAGLKPSPEQAQKIGAALAAFGSGAGVMVENNTFVVNTAESLHKAAEAALAVGGVTQLAYFGVQVLTTQGLAACARQAAVMVAASTAVNFASQQAVALAQQYGVDPAYIRIGADAIQVVMLWRAAKLQQQGCFVAGTQVLAGYDEQGRPLTRNIEALQVGDRVLSRSQLDEVDDLDPRSITAVSRHQVYQLQMVEVADGVGQIESLQSTVEHPYYVQGKGWTRADELEAGDLLLGDDGMRRTVTSSMTENTPQGVLVYNLTVEGDHTYFVEDGAGSKEFVWVHNGACDSFDNKVSHIFGPNSPW